MVSFSFPSSFLSVLQPPKADPTGHDAIHEIQTPDFMKDF